MKRYVVKDASDESKLVVIQANKPPKDHYGVLPESIGEGDHNFISMSEVTDENGDILREFSVDGPRKEAALAEVLKGDNIADSYALLNKEVYEEMFRIFYTQKSDSASANYEMWQHMVTHASLYMSQGLKAETQLQNEDGTELYSPGSALDTEEKVVAYANRKIEQADTYIVWRSNRIQQFRNERETILSS